jgi:hypothetical protein
MMPVAMVGRAEELREVGRSWERVTRTDRSGVHTVVVTGPAGIGKSLLVWAALDSLTPRPYNVLRGSAPARRCSSSRTCTPSTRPA